MKKILIKILLILALCCALSESYSSHESNKVFKRKNFDGGVASHPMKVFNGKSKVKTNKRDHIDNVREVNMPKSREDIQNIRKVAYHGKMSPSVASAEALMQETTKLMTSSTTTTPRPKRRYKKKIVPVNRADKIIIVKPKPSAKFKPSPQYPSSNELVRTSLTKPEKPNYVPDDTPFYPLMRPSPINVMPTEPPSYETVRNYVQYLKMRNQKKYAEIDDDEHPSLAIPLSTAQKKKSKVPFDGELEYFKEREKEIVKEQNRSKSSSSEESKSRDEDDNDQHDQHPYKVDNDDDNESDSSDYDDNANDESRHQDFVPFKLYAQVRHAEAEHIQPSAVPHVKEKVSLAKKNIYYKEEGYDDQMHEKGSEDLKYRFNSKKRGHKRSKRNVDVDDLPLALALFKKSELPNLTGEKLLKHLDELIKNSSVYLGDDEDPKRPVRIVSQKQGRSQKFPFYNLSENVLSQMSAHRYSENIQKYPRHKESLYRSKNIKECQEIDDEVDIEKSEEKSPPPRRLKKLGSKIDCLKKKYFGKDPFENPLFKEDEYVAATIPIPVNHTNVIKHQANPLINVYDDVLRTIRLENFAEEKKKNQEVVKDSTKLASETVPIRASLPAKLPNYSSVAGVAQLPIFDINKFLPKFAPAFNHNDDDEQEIEELLYKKKNSTERAKKHIPATTSTPPPPSFKTRQNSITNSHQIDSPSLIEKPKVKRNFKAKPLIELSRASPLKASIKSPVTIQKFIRVMPHKTHIHAHPQQRKSNYHFKFL